MQAGKADGASNGHAANADAEGRPLVVQKESELKKKEVDLQTVIDRIPWEKVADLLTLSIERASAASKQRTNWSYVLSGLVLVAGAALAWKGVIQGQAVVGFLGAALGLLLAKKAD